MVCIVSPPCVDASAFQEDGVLYMLYTWFALSAPPCVVASALRWPRALSTCHPYPDPQDQAGLHGPPEGVHGDQRSTDSRERREVHRALGHRVNVEQRTASWTGSSPTGVVVVCSGNPLCAMSRAPSTAVEWGLIGRAAEAASLCYATLASRNEGGDMRYEYTRAVR